MSPPAFVRIIVDVYKRQVLDTETDNGEQTGHVQRHGFLYDENGERKQKKLIAVELAPPFDADDEKLLESAHLLKNAGVDVLTFPDSPSGRTRVDSCLLYTSHLCTLLDKPERRVKKQVKVDYTCFTIPDEFVVGYGLDYDQKYRNLPFIGVVEQQ